MNSRIATFSSASLANASRSQSLKKPAIRMTTFSDPSFDFKGYLAGRPRYPDLLYDTVVNFHRGDRNTVLDIGTGPGLSLFPFAYTFRHLMGVDPSEGMVAQADDAWTAWKSVQESPSQLKTQDASFQVASAEELQPIADTSVDLITAATAAHWFDYTHLWPTLARVLKPGGTVAFWTYGENYLPSHPSLAPMMTEFMSSKAANLGAYWPQPGRRILENLLLDVPFPLDHGIWDESSATRVHHKLQGKGQADLSWTRGEAPADPFRMEHIMSFDALNKYFHTSSASARFFKEHPKMKEENPDMIERHTQELRKRVLDERRRGIASNDNLDDDHIRVAWPLGLMMIRKK